ncbi:MAG: translation initiation factor Sui1 [Thermodesulfobacteriota bacterium]
MNDDSRLVYSTETGRICPTCEKPAAKCRCKKQKKDKKTPPQPPSHPNDGIVRIQRETKGRKGKTVTAVFGVPLADKDLKEFAKTLKSRCGTGGTVKNGVIELQGDHREALKEAIEKQGYTVKLAGG